MPAPLPMLPEGAVRVHGTTSVYVLGDAFVAHATLAMRAGDDEWCHLFNAAVERAQRHQHVQHVIVHTATRGTGKGDPEGWLEFLLVIFYATGGRMTIGCIQRVPGGSFEFHS